MYSTRTTTPAQHKQNPARPRRNRQDQKRGSFFIKKNDYKSMVDINDLLGIPYKDHGRDASGYDCYGLAIEVARRYGYKLNDVIYHNHNLALSAENAPTLNVTRIDKPREGALLEMQYNNELHIGICLNNREFIHMTKNGCRVNLIGSLKVRGIYGINTII